MRIAREKNFEIDDSGSWIGEIFLFSFLECYKNYIFFNNYASALFRSSAKIVKHDGVTASDLCLNFLAV